MDGVNSKVLLAKGSVGVFVIKKPLLERGFLIWWRGGDLNSRPSGYEPDELPDCSTPR